MHGLVEEPRPIMSGVSHRAAPMALRDARRDRPVSIKRAIAATTLARGGHFQSVDRGSLPRPMRRHREPVVGHHPWQCRAAADFRCDHPYSCLEGH